MIDETKLNILAQEWDPTPFLQALQSTAAMPGMTQPGQPPMGAPQGDYASMLGQMPQAQPQMPGGMPMPQMPGQPLSKLLGGM